MDTDSGAVAPGNGCRQGVGTADMRADVDLTKYDAVTEVIIACALSLCNRLGCGFLEKVYQRGLVHLMRAAGLDVQEKVSLRVMLDGVCLGEYEADIVVNGCILVELKAADALSSAHVAQCINYLRATGLRVCLLVNFGRPRLQWKRIVY